MKHWSDDIEAMRPEAREAVASGMEAMRAMIGDRAAIDPSVDKFVRAKQQREMFAVSMVTVPEAVDREIAGVRCRVIVPENTPATAVYLHFHGCGMILGALPTRLVQTRNVPFGVSTGISRTPPLRTSSRPVESR